MRFIKVYEIYDIEGSFKNRIIQTGNINIYDMVSGEDL